MSYQRVSFSGRLAGLDFSMDCPPGFSALAIPDEVPGFDDPAVSAPLAVLSSGVAVALITVSARPAYDDGSVMDWIRYLAGHYDITLTGLMPGKIGRDLHRHPAILCEGHQTQDRTLLRMRIAIFEDGGRLVTAHGMCPDELAASFLPALEHCVQTVELVNPVGPTAALAGDLPVPVLEVVR